MDTHKNKDLNVEVYRDTSLQLILTGSRVYYSFIVEFDVYVRSFSLHNGS